MDNRHQCMVPTMGSAPRIGETRKCPFRGCETVFKYRLGHGSPVLNWDELHGRKARHAEEHRTFEYLRSFFVA